MRRPLLLVLCVHLGCTATVTSPDTTDAGSKSGSDAGSLPSALDASMMGTADASIMGSADASVASAADAGASSSLVLQSVTPSSGGASASTAVTLHGAGFGAVSGVTVGGVAATDVQRIDSASIAATFAPVALTAIGPKSVAVSFADGETASLDDAFEYLFDEDPVVFVHGYPGHATDFDTMKQNFEAAGYPAEQLFAIQYSDNLGSNLKNLTELTAYIEQVLAQTGADKVDLVAHSMGALSARLYLERNADPPVRDFVTVAGANHGNNLAFLGIGDGASEMYPAYACQGQSLNDVQFELNGCLTSSGRTVDADETPHAGAVAWLAIRTTTDEVINPSQSECLNQAQQNDCSDPVNTSVDFVSHNGMLTDANVFNLVIAHLRARNRSHP